MRKLCWFALPFCAALFAVQYVLDGVLILPLAGIMAALALPAAFLRRARAALACLGFVLGLLWFEGYTLLFHALRNSWMEPLRPLTPLSPIGPMRQPSAGPGCWCACT